MKGEDFADDQPIFNYRLSRARRASEKAFGILVANFRVFQQSIDSNHVYIDKVTCVAVVLHNFIRVIYKKPCFQKCYKRKVLSREL